MADADPHVHLGREDQRREEDVSPRASLHRHRDAHVERRGDDRRDEPDGAEHEGVDRDGRDHQQDEHDAGDGVDRHRRVLEPAQAQVRVEGLALGVAALTGPHELDRAVVPLHLLGVEAAQGGHPADVGAGPGADLGEVPRALDLQRQERVLDLGVLDPRRGLVVLGHRVAQRLGREDRVLAAEDRHVPATEHVLHVEGRELRPLPGDEELRDRALDRVRVDRVDRGDAADAAVRDDLLLELLDGLLARDGVAVDAEQVVHALDEREAVVERADLLVGVLADVVDVDLGELLDPVDHRGVRPGIAGRDLDGLVGRVVDDHVDDVRQARLGEQRLDDRADRLFFVVRRDDAADRRACRRERLDALDELVRVLLDLPEGLVVDDHVVVEMCHGVPPGESCGSAGRTGVCCV